MGPVGIAANNLSATPPKKPNLENYSCDLGKLKSCRPTRRSDEMALTCMAYGEPDLALKLGSSCRLNSQLEEARHPQPINDVLWYAMQLNSAKHDWMIR